MSDPSSTAGLADTHNNMCTQSSHEASKRDPLVWASMAYIGIQEAGPEYSLELRNCFCGSTLGVRVTPTAPQQK